MGDDVVVNNEVRARGSRSELGLTSHLTPRVAHARYIAHWLTFHHYTLLRLSSSSAQVSSTNINKGLLIYKRLKVAKPQLKSIKKKAELPFHFICISFGLLI